MEGSPSLELTLALMIAALLVAAFANWQLRRPFLERIRLVPWFAVQFVAVAIALVMAAHLVTLLTGQPLVSRRGGY